MSTNRKASTTTAGADPGAAQEHLTVLYTAHQVHAVAQMVLQQITGNWSSSAPWRMPAGAGFSPYAGSGNGTPHATTQMGVGPGFHPAMPPALFYWYP